MPVVFEARLRSKVRPRPELLDIVHPLVAFVREGHRSDKGHIEPVSALRVPASAAGVDAGLYVVATDFWRLEGLRRDIRLRTAALLVEDHSILDCNQSEKLLDAAISFGKRVDPEALRDLRTMINGAFDACEMALAQNFLTERQAFREENRRQVEQARVLVRERSETRLKTLYQQADEQRRSSDEKRRRAAQLTFGRIRKLEADRDQRLAQIEATAEPTTRSRAVAAGIILAEED